ncbi:TolC family type I secretion outer membrane protein [Rhodoplanes sp. Z2-YC6860]|nr:TolC family type I secretion outer membrane protein [Rhodoplanes sp. Z2-YC6860]
MAALALAVGPASGDTIRWALTQAYINNPNINAQRAAVRATDEGVPKALSGYRPRISLSAAAGEAFLDSTARVQGVTGPNYPRTIGNNAIQTYGATYSQTLLNGNQTANQTRQAEQQVSAARETLRNTEQTILLQAATAYMNLIRDAATLSLQRSNVEVLQEQLRQTRDRYDVGEVTRTDVAQAESRLAQARATMLQAESNYTSSRSTYRQVIGVEPGRLDPASPVDRLSPAKLEQGIVMARSQHPAVTTSMFNVDSAVFAVKVAEASLYPTLTAVGSVQKSYGSTSVLSNLETFSAIGQAQLNVPIYQGGTEYANIRQAKELLQQQRVNLDNQRDIQQQNLVQTWGALDAAKAAVLANQTAVNAAEIALNGVREEARVGQRTTLDVLNAQQELVNARVALVSAQRDRVVNSYGVLAAVGGLSPQTLRLDVPIYDPVVHYHQVRDTWAGVRTPDGK